MQLEQKPTMPEEPYKVHLENIFEGPMDLLVHLIKKNELDIYI
jgi:segregation and condensation protein A